MLPPAVSALYAGVSALILVWLSLRAIAARTKPNAGFGDGGDPGLARAVRAHGIAAETVPTHRPLIALERLGLRTASIAMSPAVCGVAGALLTGHATSRFVS